MFFHEILKILDSFVDESVIYIDAGYVFGEETDGEHESEGAIITADV